MQVFGLSGHISRNGRGRRVFSPRSPRPSTAAKKRDAVARWRQAMGHGFSAEQAAEAVAVPRSTLIPGTAGGAALEAAATGAGENLDAGAGRGGRGLAPRPSHVGPGQARSAPETPGLAVSDASRLFSSG